MEHRILSLSGGGMRGIFQSTFLERLEDRLGEHVAKSFDMIAATSTGALVGLALAHGVPPREITRLYTHHGPALFHGRPLAVFRAGSRYSSPLLRRLLYGIFEDATLGDLATDVLICASTLDTFEGRVFTRTDRDISIVDAAMASAAAPTYFDPVTPAGGSRTYIDGGLWANDPSVVAMDHATNVLGFHPGSVRMLSLGTGRVPQGRSVREVSQSRALSLATARLLLDSSSTLQSWVTEQRCASYQSSSRWIRVNPVLRTWIGLDEAGPAIELLRPLAEREFDERQHALLEWLRQPRRTGAAGSPVGSPLSSYRNVLNDLTGRMNVPHAMVRRYRHVIGADSQQDTTAVSVTTTVQEGERLLWRTESISLTQDAPQVDSLADVDFSVTTEPGCDLDFLALDEKTGNLKVMLVFVPELDGPASRDYAYHYAWSGTWDPLRATGEDRANTEITGQVTRLEVEFIFPPAAEEAEVIPPLGGNVTIGMEGDRKTIMWSRENPPEGAYVVRLKMKPLAR